MNALHLVQMLLSQPINEAPIYDDPHKTNVCDNRFVWDETHWDILARVQNFNSDALCDVPKIQRYEAFFVIKNVHNR